MSWTDRELAENVLQDMGVVPLGQSPFAEHVNYVLKIWASVYDQLQDPGLVPFPSDDIPAYACWPLVKYLTVEAGPKFGRNYPESKKDVAISELSRSRFGGQRASFPAKSKDY